MRKMVLYAISLIFLLSFSTVTLTSATGSITEEESLQLASNEVKSQGIKGVLGNAGMVSLSSWRIPVIQDGSVTHVILVNDIEGLPPVEIYKQPEPFSEDSLKIINQEDALRIAKKTDEMSSFLAKHPEAQLQVRLLGVRDDPKYASSSFPYGFFLVKVLYIDKSKPLWRPPDNPQASPAEWREWVAVIVLRNNGEVRNIIVRSGYELPEIDEEPSRTIGANNPLFITVSLLGVAIPTLTVLGRNKCR